MVPHIVNFDIYPNVGAFASVTGLEFLPITLPAEIIWYPPDDAPAQAHLVHQTAEAGLGKAGEMMGLHQCDLPSV